MRTDQLREPVADLLERAGSSKPVRKVVPAADLELTSSHAVEGTDIELDGTLESMGDGITLTGTVRFEWEGDCRRCLDPVRAVEEAEVREIFSRLDDDDTFPLGDNEVDLGPVMREAVMLNLPLAPLCDEECRGPAPDAYPAEPETDPDPDAERPRDPRWAALDDLDLG